MRNSRNRCLGFWRVQGRENLSRVKITLLVHTGKVLSNSLRFLFALCVSAVFLIHPQESHRRDAENAKRREFLIKPKTTTFQMLIANSRSVAVLPRFALDAGAGIQRVSAALSQTTFQQERSGCGVYLHRAASLIEAHSLCRTWQ